ncbi:MAG: peptidyl-prolyl cis-trans isomerase [Lachnospiraceae bacterium]|uniref:peptidylprolyl isomerase n=1 Tax=Candidatus Merdisoma sp. JLR.KK006 TaxID=3112626 RepID=UPI002FF3FBE2|nr:peptidyl-prolyl cis-trans isomerase [Lachnospiraceae bacterium]
MKKRIIRILSLVFVLAFVLTGCSGKLDASETIAVLDETTNIRLGEFSLMLRYQQAQMETYYGSMLGGGIYQQEMPDTGEIYGDTAKKSQMDEFKLLYVLEAEAPDYEVVLTEEEKAAIAEAAKAFMDANTPQLKKAVGAEQADVEHLLTLMTIQNKMYDVLTADVDSAVSDEEAAQKRITYAFIATTGTETDSEGNTIDLTDEEKAEKKAALQAVVDEAKTSGDLSAAAEGKENITVNTTTYGADSSSPAESVRAAADTLQDGEFAEIVEAETGYYAVQMVSTFDREATDSQKETIVQQRRDELYNEKCEELQEAHTFTTVDEVMGKLTFSQTFVLKTEQ